MSESTLFELHGAVLSGEAEQARDLTGRMLDAGSTPEQLLDEGLIPAMTDASFFFARMGNDAMDWATGLGAGKWRYWEGRVPRR